MDLKPILAPLLSVGTVLDFNITTIGLRTAILEIAGCNNFTECLEVGRQAPVPVDRGFRGKSSYVESTISLSGIQLLLQYMQGPLFIENCTSCGVIAVMIDSYGGKINSFSPNDTAFPHRSMSYHIQTVAYWTNTSLYSTMVNSWVNTFYSAMQPFVTPYAYFNYIDKDLQHWGNAYFATNYQQLQYIKNKYDPSNLYLYPQSIPKP